MSIQQISAFANMIQNNAAIQQEIAQVQQSISGIIAIAQREGYDFSADELISYTATLHDGGGNELSDSELESISGVGLPTCARVAPPGVLARRAYC